MVGLGELTDESTPEMMGYLAVHWLVILVLVVVASLAGIGLMVVIDDLRYKIERRYLRRRGK